MIAKFGVIVRGWSGSASEAVRRCGECFNDLVSGFAVECLNDARLIKHNTHEVNGAKLVQHLVVCDHDARRRQGAVTRHDRWNAEAGSLTRGLFCHGKRREDKHSALRVIAHSARPLQLNKGLAHAAVSKHCRASLPERPCYDVALMIKEGGVEGVAVD